MRFTVVILNSYMEGPKCFFSDTQVWGKSADTEQTALGGAV